VNQEQKEYLSEVIDCLLNPVSPEEPRALWLSSTEAKRLAEAMQSMLDRIDEIEASQAITLRDQFAIAIAGGVAADPNAVSSVAMLQVYAWADEALKGRGQ
jgi:5'-deoxynucleotidase YfbR-like HD superfamily hydrolase